jgi:hypothetical protein
MPEEETLEALLNAGKSAKGVKGAVLQQLDDQLGTPHCITSMFLQHVLKMAVATENKARENAAFRINDIQNLAYVAGNLCCLVYDLRRQVEALKGRGAEMPVAHEDAAPTQKHAASVVWGSLETGILQDSITGSRTLKIKCSKYEGVLVITKEEARFALEELGFVHDDNGPHLYLNAGGSYAHFEPGEIQVNEHGAVYLVRVPNNVLAAALKGLVNGEAKVHPWKEEQ